MDSITRAAKAIKYADALLICAGAGIGVDSGLPDFRGNEGFWKAYPPLEKAGTTFYDIADPTVFEDDPELAWGFYGHRLNLYRATVPHAGFTMMKEWADAKPFGSFVFTSNVDGQFQKAGFDQDRVAECHGSIHHLQCLYDCSKDIWSAANETVIVDEKTFRAAAPLPRCPNCLRLARPNVLMFGDWGWLSTRTDPQEQLLHEWFGIVRKERASVAVIELGAGDTLPTVRMMAERLATKSRGTLIRINPHDYELPEYDRAIALPLGSLDALTQIITQF